MVQAGVNTDTVPTPGVLVRVEDLDSAPSLLIQLVQRPITLSPALQLSCNEIYCYKE